MYQPHQALFGRSYESRYMVTCWDDFICLFKSRHFIFVLNRSISNRSWSRSYDLALFKKLITEKFASETMLQMSLNCENRFLACVLNLNRLIDHQLQIFFLEDSLKKKKSCITIILQWVKQLLLSEVFKTGRLQKE